MQGGFLLPFQQRLHACVHCLSGVAEQQRNTPQGGDRHERIDHAAENGGLTAEDPRHEVKLEDADKAQLTPPMISSSSAILSMIIRFLLSFLSIGKRGRSLVWTLYSGICVFSSNSKKQEADAVLSCCRAAAYSSSRGT